jgi:hypothetical protein
MNLKKDFAMPSGKGMIVLMGSGELTATMVEVHKELLGRLATVPKAVFLDTPAGFQLNVDQISKKAQDYFQAHVQHSLAVASFKSHETITPYETEQAYHSLRAADFARKSDLCGAPMAAIIHTGNPHQPHPGRRLPGSCQRGRTDGGAVYTSGL